MMKQIKRAFCLLLAAATAASLLMPASAEVPKKDTYPIVFVHGLIGFGEDAGISKALSPWGMMGGDTKEYLNDRGYECYVASLGPVSSAWDRACELYAQLVGARVDYGAAHSAAHNHDRFGKTYKEPLVPDWSGERKLHLIGHSFGGVTARLLAQWLEYGSADERAATPADELSPLFSGKLGGRVASITTFAAPHNGSTAAEPVIGVGELLDRFMIVAAVAGAVIPFADRAYPLRLEHFGVSSKDLYRAPWKAFGAYKAFDESADRMDTDLTIDGAAALNKAIECLPDVYYFSYYGQMTQDDGSGSQAPKENTSLLMRPFAKRIGKRKESFRTAGGTLIDDTWLPNDGLVNVISGKYPFTEPHRNYDSNIIRPGVWQVMPMIDHYDHLDFWGGLRLGGAPGYDEFCLAHAAILERIQ